MFELDNIDSVKLMGHLAYGLILMSFLVKKMLVLRTFAITASCCSIIYNYNFSSGPVWIPIQWNILFITVNCYHITMALLARRQIKINEVEEYVYGQKFQTMTRVEFKRLLKVGFTRAYHPGQKLIQSNESLGAVFLILEGEARVSINGLVVATLQKGEFIGEMSFLTGQQTKADVTISSNARIHFWDNEDLKAFFGKNPMMLAKFHSAIGNQLIERLITKSVSEAKAAAA